MAVCCLLWTPCTWPWYTVAADDGYSMAFFNAIMPSVHLIESLSDVIPFGSRSGDHPAQRDCSTQGSSCCCGASGVDAEEKATGGQAPCGFTLETTSNTAAGGGRRRGWLLEPESEDEEAEEGVP